MGGGGGGGESSCYLVKPLALESDQGVVCLRSRRPCKIVAGVSLLLVLME